MTATTHSEFSSSSSVQCPRCGGAYAPAEASLCDCVTERRSLRCPACSHCSCSGRAADIRERYRASTLEVHQRIKQEREAAFPPPPPPDNLARPLVLVADDSPDVRLVVCRQLEALGYGVMAVANGEEAWKAVKQFRPEIALLDGLMPKMDGRIVAKRIKEDFTLHTRTVIMTSLYTSAAQKEEAFREFHVDGYLAKPLKAQVLRETLARLLESPPVA